MSDGLDCGDKILRWFSGAEAIVEELYCPECDRITKQQKNVEFRDRGIMYLCSQCHSHVPYECSREITDKLILAKLN
jgi:hypothetical protein